MTEKVLQFRSGNAVVNLNMPAAMMQFSATRIRKLFRIIGPWCGWGEDDNNRSVREFFEYAEPVLEELNRRHNEAVFTLQREYRDVSQLPRKEAQNVRAKNKRLRDKALETRRAYESHLKKMETLKELRDKYDFYK